MPVNRLAALHNAHAPLPPPPLHDPAAITAPWPMVRCSPSRMSTQDPPARPQTPRSAQAPPTCPSPSAFPPAAAMARRHTPDPTPQRPGAGLRSCTGAASPRAASPGLRAAADPHGPTSSPHLLGLVLGALRGTAATPDAVAHAPWSVAGEGADRAVFAKFGPLQCVRRLRCSAHHVGLRAQYAMQFDPVTGDLQDVYDCDGARVTACDGREFLVSGPHFAAPLHLRAPSAALATEWQEAFKHASRVGRAAQNRPRQPAAESRRSSPPAGSRRRSPAPEEGRGSPVLEERRRSPAPGEARRSPALEERRRSPPRDKGCRSAEQRRQDKRRCPAAFRAAAGGPGPEEGIDWVVAASATSAVPDAGVGLRGERGRWAPTCPQCEHRFNGTERVPLVLDCQHSVCRRCLAHGAGPATRCPQCAAVSTAVEAFPKNYALLDLRVRLKYAEFLRLSEGELLDAAGATCPVCLEGFTAVDPVCTSSPPAPLALRSWVFTLCIAPPPPPSPTAGHRVWMAIAQGMSGVGQAERYITVAAGFVIRGTRRFSVVVACRARGRCFTALEAEGANSRFG